MCVWHVDVSAGVTQEEGHTGFLHLPSAVLAFIFLARRIQPFVVERYPMTNVRLLQSLALESY